MPPAASPAVCLKNGWGSGFGGGLPAFEQIVQQVSVFPEFPGQHDLALLLPFEENGFDEVLVCYSMSNFSTDSNIFLLGR